MAPSLTFAASELFCPDSVPTRAITNDRFERATWRRWCADRAGLVIGMELQSANTLAPANGDAIKRLVEFRVQYERASKRVAGHGAILPPKNKNTKVGQWNPFWSVMRKASTVILALESELGLAPVRRGKAEQVSRPPM